MTSRPSPGEPPVQAYGLPRPDLAEAHDEITTVFADRAPAMWARLLKTAGLTGDETGDAALSLLISAMQAEDPVTALCAQSLTIRLNSYRHLATTNDILRSAE